MDDTTRRAWLDLADDLYRLRHLDVTGKSAEVEANGPPGRLAEAISSLVAAAGGRWTPDVQAGIMGLPQASKLDVANPTATPLGTACTSYMRALRHALLVATGRSGDIHASERAWLRRAVESLPDHAHLAGDIAPSEARDDDVRPGAVGFAFAWKPRRGKGPLVLDDAVAGLRHVTGDDAPVVAELKPDGADWFVLRMIDGVLHRPVFSPGSWEPASVATFSDACTGGVAWVDNPFMPPPAWDASVAALADVAVRGAPAKDAGEREAALGACLARAGVLVAVDGVVHRACPEPTLHLAMRRLPRLGRDNMPNAIRQAWSMGNVDAFTSQSPDRCFPPVMVCDALAGLDKGHPEDPDGGQKTAWHVRSTDLGLGLGDSDALEELAESAKGGITDTKFWALSHPYVSDLPSVRKVDTAVFRPDPGALPRALARHAARAGAPWPDPKDMAAGDDVGNAEGLASRLRAIAETERNGIYGFKPRAGYLVYLDPTGHDELGRAGIRALGRAVAAALERAPAAEHEELCGFAP